MRSLLAAGALVIALSAPARADDKVPVWLGIQYDRSGAVGLVIKRVYDGSAAAEAGLARDDELVAVDGQRVTPQTDLTPIITSRKVGDHLKLQVLRGPKLITLEAVLLPRADSELVQRRLVGRPAPAFTITRASDGAVIDLAALAGKVAVLAFFPPSCDGCASVVSALGPWAEQHARAPVVVLGATPIGEVASLRAYLQRNPIVVPVGALPAPVDGADEQPWFADPRNDAVTFVVIDARGIVRMASIVPAGDDPAAGVEDVGVAAERALKARRRR